jgi:hypothetical protein
LLTAYRTDPYLKDNLIRLLLQVDRENDRWNTDGGYAASADGDEQVDAPDPRSSVFAGCGGAESIAPGINKPIENRM